LQAKDNLKHPYLHLIFKGHWCVHRKGREATTPCVIQFDTVLISTKMAILPQTLPTMDLGNLGANNEVLQTPRPQDPAKPINSQANLKQEELMKAIKFEIKTWEREYLAEHGKKPTKEDVMQDIEICKFAHEALKTLAYYVGRRGLVVHVALCSRVGYSLVGRVFYFFSGIIQTIQ
jgi:hypothetical protein